MDYSSDNGERVRVMHLQTSTIAVLTASFKPGNSLNLRVACRG